MSTTKTWTRDEINALLLANPLAVERAITRLFQFQTADEQSAGGTRWSNGQGFSAPHARMGTYYARWILSGRRLSGPHLERATKIAVRHSQQLVAYANGTLR
jgi:hypothetical protein